MEVILTTIVDFRRCCWYNMSRWVVIPARYGMAKFTAMQKMEEIVMKSRPCRSRKNCSVLLIIFCVALCLLVPAGCSGGTDQVEAAPSEAELERDQLKSENKDLQTELDKTSADLKDMETRLKELEDALGALQEAQATSLEAEAPEAAPATIDITPPERSPSELLLGQWYFHEFHEEGVWSWIQTLVFNKNGTGTISKTFYVPEEGADHYIVKDDYGNVFYELTDVDMTDSFTWSLQDDTLHLDVSNGQSGSFIYAAADQTLTPTGGNDKYVRKAPDGMEGYVERSLYAENKEAKEAARRKRFLGTWYYDVTTFTFNDDGTGIWDIPEVGNQPAEQREFSYSVNDNGGNGGYWILTIDWDVSDYWLLFPEFNADGSMSLMGASQSEAIMKWTRNFDPDNCPITAQIISTGIGVFSGSIFSDMLSGYSGS